jgi:hypothetical protein
MSNIAALCIAKGNNSISYFSKWNKKSLCYSPFHIQVVDDLVEQTSKKKRKRKSLPATFNFEILCLRN